MDAKSCPALSDAEAWAWLLWQAEMGADEAIGETPVDWFAPPSPESEARGEDEITFESLAAALAAFDGCGLKRTAKTLCFYRGAPHARVMLIGEAPGREEDLAGKPFVGRAGQLLDRMLAAIGLDEASVHITNIVYWRPPGNRDPTPEEVMACRPFLLRQIELVTPDCLVALGGPAAKSLTGTEEGIMRLRGRWRKIQAAGKDIPLLPMLHPAYLLRTPAAKRLAWRDLIALQQFLRERQE